MNVKYFLLLASIVLAITLTISCSSSGNADPLETKDFYYHGTDFFKIINKSEHDITGVLIRAWTNSTPIIEYDELIPKKGGSKDLGVPPDEVLPEAPLMCIKAENRPKPDCIKFNDPSYTWDGEDLYITRLPHPLE
jgi:hypothetical protein